MKKSYLPAVLALHTILFFTSLFILFKSPFQVLSATTHVVISEIQIGGGTSTDEFVELYNPTSSPVDLTNWRLSKKTAGGTETDLIAATMSGTLAANGYLLVAHENYDGAVAENITYSGPTTVAPDNTVLLYNNNGILVDKVGMGTASDVETSAATEPATNRSIERKAQASSTADSMSSGGADETAGNGFDSDNNSQDFVHRTLAQGADPQNTSSATETPVPDATPSPSPSEEPSPSPEVSPSPSPEVSPSPSASPSPEPSPSPEASVSPSPSPSEEPSPSPSVEPSPSASPSPSPSLEPSPSPSLEPSPSPSSSVEPSPSPSEEPSPSPSPSSEPSSSPSPEPSPSPSPSPSASPAVSPSPSPTPPSNIIFQGFLFTCRIQYRQISTRFFSFFIPQIRCSLNR